MFGLLTGVLLRLDDGLYNVNAEVKLMKIPENMLGILGNIKEYF